ncbi:MAG: hypothetical protein ACRCUY_13045 [Thermoguttaceae bacterium]
MIVETQMLNFPNASVFGNEFRCQNKTRRTNAGVHAPARNVGSSPNYVGDSPNIDANFAFQKI